MRSSIACAKEIFGPIRILTALYAFGAGVTIVFIWLVRNNQTLVDVEVWTHAIIVFAFASRLPLTADRLDCDPGC
jgi:hypothetical protein